MLKSIAFAGALIAGSFLVVADASAAKKKASRCSSTVGEGTGITPDLAKTNASTALKNLQAKLGLKGAGKVKSDCSANLIVMNTCKATQRACK